MVAGRVFSRNDKAQEARTSSGFVMLTHGSSTSATAPSANYHLPRVCVRHRLRPIIVVPRESFIGSREGLALSGKPVAVEQEHDTAIGLVRGE